MTKRPCPLIHLPFRAVVHLFVLILYVLYDHTTLRRVLFFLFLVSVLVFFLRGVRRRKTASKPRRKVAASED